MASITIRNLDEETKRKLRLRAAHNARSMEEEAREVLRAGVGVLPGSEGNLFDAIRARFKRFGGVELERLPRETMPEPPDFDE